MSFFGLYLGLFLINDAVFNCHYHRDSHVQFHAPMVSMRMVLFVAAGFWFGAFKENGEKLKHP